MPRRHALIRVTLVLIVAIAVSGAAAAGGGDDLVDRIFHRSQPADAPLTMKQVAQVVEEIDEALFRKGTIGVKAPDVWGQNRMTKYRAEYEAVMGDNLGRFQDILNAAQRRTDVAGLTNAMAVSASLSPARGPLGAPRPSRVAVVPTAPGGSTPISINNVASAPASGSTDKEKNAESGTGPEAAAEPATPDLSDIAARLDSMQKTVLNLPTDIVKYATKTGDPGVGLEPTIRLDEQDRYLNHLNQLRRTSAGDDLTDLPGYGLYLVRMPISVLPGDSTRRGKAAMVTIQAKHDLSDDLLENTFRDVVCRDVIYRLKETILYAYRNETVLATNEDYQSSADELAENFDFQTRKFLLELKLRRLEKLHKDGSTISKLERRVAEAEAGRDSSEAPEPAESKAGPKGSGPGFPPLPSIGFGITGPNPAGSPQSEILQVVGIPYLLTLSRWAAAATSFNELGIDSSILSWLNSETLNAHRFMRQAVIEGDKAREVGLESRGVDELFRAAEIEPIGDALLHRDYGRLNRLRNQFFTRLYFRRTPRAFFDEARYMAEDDAEFRIQMDQIAAANLRPADILCFVILLQAVLVDRHLKQDVDAIHQRLKTDREPFPYANVVDWPSLDSERGPGLRFYDFRPTPLARQIFAEYVRRKWPIHVYALDPQVEQQNILDAYSQRTELQLALSVALAAGKVNFNNATKYARRLDEDLVTIGLNRTAVGFGAGKSTFGWQFYPRVQTPPAQNNLARIAGTILYNGPRPDYDLTNRRIEPGQRECVAVMVVPNFVPAIRMTSVANWFGLGKHSEQKFDAEDLLRLSRKLQAARCALGATADESGYRPGELARMSDRVDQLESMMPTQDFRVVLPDEGDLAGSEIFSSDAANLSPTLYTWFGEPPAIGKESQVFLLGKGFSVVESKVVAGGVDASHVLLSRNVVKVSIPATARPTDVAMGKVSKKCFDVHLATPNGISDFHLLIPAAEETKPKEEAAPKTGYAVEAKAIDLAVECAVDPHGRLHARGVLSDPAAKIQITLKDPTGVVPPALGFSLAMPDIQKLKIAPYRSAHPLPFDPRDNGYFVCGPEMASLADFLAAHIVAAGVDPRNPPADFKTLKLGPAKIRPLLGDRWGAEVEAGGTLTVNVTFRLSAFGPHLGEPDELPPALPEGGFGAPPLQQPPMPDVNPEVGSAKSGVRIDLAVQTDELPPLPDAPDVASDPRNSKLEGRNPTASPSLGDPRSPSSGVVKLVEPSTKGAASRPNSSTRR